MQPAVKHAAELLLHLGIAPSSRTGERELRVFTNGLPGVETTTTLDKKGSIRWVSIRAPGVQTRSVFPTQEPADMGRAIAKSILVALLELAALVEGEAKGGIPPSEPSGTSQNVRTGRRDTFPPKGRPGVRGLGRGGAFFRL